jgi:hypothetical protein
MTWHLLCHAIRLVTCFDLQFWHSTRPMMSFCIFIAYINTEGILFNVKITRWDGEVTSLSGADKREVRDNREKWWEYREKSKYFSNCTTFHIRGALSWHSYVIMYLLCRQLGRDVVVRFDCENSAIDVIINFLWKIFHKRFWPPMYYEYMTAQYFVHFFLSI